MGTGEDSPSNNSYQPTPIFCKVPFWCNGSVTLRGTGSVTGKKSVTVYFAELFVLHQDREQDRTPLDFIHIFPFPFLLPFPVLNSVTVIRLSHAVSLTASQSRFSQTCWCTGMTILPTLF